MSDITPPRASRRERRQRRNAERASQPVNRAEQWFERLMSFDQSASPLNVFQHSFDFDLTMALEH